MEHPFQHFPHTHLPKPKLTHTQKHKQTHGKASLRIHNPGSGVALQGPKTSAVKGADGEDPLFLQQEAKPEPET